MKKKIISGIIICLVLLSSYLITSATSDEVGLQSKKQNSEVTVTFKVSKVDDGLDAISGKIVYDKSKLEFVKIEEGDARWQKPSYNDNSGKFTLLISSETIYEACDAIKITFKVKENETASTAVTISEIVGATSKDETITLKDVTTTIDLGSDTDGDGNNNEIEENTNTVDGDGNNNEIDDNTNSMDDDNLDDNTNSIDTNTVDDDNNQNYTNIISGNTDDIANGKLPQTGEKATGYAFMGIIIGLIIASLILLIKQIKINKRR